MTKRIIFIIWGMLAFAFANFSFAQAKDQHILAGDLDIYYGIVPAKLAQRGHKSNKQSDELHDKKYLSKASHHLVVAVFDHGSGARIIDANVIATVTPLGLAPQRKKLKPMEIEDNISYGEYFGMSGSDPYRIELSVTRGKNSVPVKTDFEYRHSE